MVFIWFFLFDHYFIRVHPSPRLLSPRRKIMECAQHTRRRQYALRRVLFVAGDRILYAFYPRTVHTRFRIGSSAIGAGKIKTNVITY